MLADVAAQPLQPAGGSPAQREAVDGTDAQLQFTTSGFNATIEVKALNAGAGLGGLGLGSDDMSSAGVVQLDGSADLSSWMYLNSLALAANAAVSGPFTATADFGIVPITLTAANVTLGGTVGLNLNGSNYQLSTMPANPNLATYFSGDTANLGGTGSVTPGVAANKGAGLRNYIVSVTLHCLRGTPWRSASSVLKPCDAAARPSRRSPVAGRRSPVASLVANSIAQPHTEET